MRKFVIPAAVILVLQIILFGCKGKVEEAESPKELKVEVKEEAAPAPPSIGPHGGNDIREWIRKDAAKAEPEVIEKAKGAVGKFTMEEIVAGMAVRPKPEYWDKASKKDKLKTLGIINTTLSKARIKAGLAEEASMLNSTLYLEDENSVIIAVSTPGTGSHLY